MDKLVIASMAALALGCAPLDGGSDASATEVISRVELSFTPLGGGDSRVFVFSDPDGDGGISGVADPVVLSAGTQYELRVTFINELLTPPVDITADIEDEAEEHLVLVLGDGVAGPASTPTTALVTHAYADLESDYGPNAIGDDLPLGLVNTITAEQSGSSTLRVMLRHLPELNGNAQKTDDLLSSIAAGEALPGNVDVDVSFELTIQ